MLLEGMTAAWLERTGAVVLCAATACASEAKQSPPSSPSSEAVPEAHETWARFDEVRGWPALNERPFPTRGHLIKPSHAIVRISPEARAEYLALVTDSVLPDGATIALFHQSRDGHDVGLVYVMEKRGGSWTFVVLDADGRVMAENVSGCALCHRGGVADSVFGLPRTLAEPVR